MAGLIARVRHLIGDPAGGSQEFDDETIQVALDQHRRDAWYWPLQQVPTQTPTGTLYLDYYANVEPWEDGAVLVDAGWNVVTPSLAEPLLGHWRFSANQNPPLYLIGRLYDVYAAAADLLEAWAAKAKLEFDFSTDGQSFHRSQKAEALRQLAAEYRRKQRPMVAAQTRTDVGVWSW
jgi:hypothetical protein